MTFSTVSKTAYLRLALFLALSLSGALAAHPVLAQEKYAAELRKICAEDYKKLCASVTPGGGAIRDCMLANIDKLTPQCRTGVEEWKKTKEKS